MTLESEGPPTPPGRVAEFAQLLRQARQRALRRRMSAWQRLTRIVKTQRAQHQQLMLQRQEEENERIAAARAQRASQMLQFKQIVRLFGAWRKVTADSREAVEVLIRCRFSGLPVGVDHALLTVQLLC